MAVTGSRPRVPTKSELDRIRYTPITAGFAPLAELSRQIANRRGLSADIEANGETKGVLLDVAELWEMYVLSVLRKAASPLTVKHGALERMTSCTLLRSDVSDKEIGTLIPDAILFQHGEIRGIVDAKYKSIHPSANAPQGPQHEDLYQIAAYLGRYASNTTTSTLGVLAYPHDPSRPTVSSAFSDPAFVVPPCLHLP
ncbi:MAG: 5-methylcytosine restriction system specificity protein McrC [Syntrophobacteraceae bacterium]